MTYDPYDVSNWTVEQLLANTKSAPDTSTIGGDILDKDRKPTGHKMRGTNEHNVLIARAAREELKRRGVKF